MSQHKIFLSFFCSRQYHRVSIYLSKIRMTDVKQTVSKDDKLRCHVLALSCLSTQAKKKMSCLGDRE